MFDRILRQKVIFFISMLCAVFVNYKVYAGTWNPGCPSTYCGVGEQSYACLGENACPNGWTSCHCIGTGVPTGTTGCYTSGCSAPSGGDPEDPPTPPTCANLSGPQHIMRTADDIPYSVDVVESTGDGDSNFSCSWSFTDNDGDFNDKRCIEPTSDVSYDATSDTSKYGLKTINFTITDTGGTATCSSDVNVYSCSGLEPYLGTYSASNILRKGADGNYMAAAGVTYKVDHMLYGLDGDDPTFYYRGWTEDLDDPEQSCGTLQNENSYTLSWTAPSTIGEVCKVDSRVTVNNDPLDNVEGGCPSAKIKVVTNPPVCGDLSIRNAANPTFVTYSSGSGGMPISTCDDDVTLRSSAHDGDVSVIEPLTFTWSVDCDSGNDGSLAGSTGSIETWTPPKDVFSGNSELCDVTVVVNDGYVNTTCEYPDAVNLYYNYNLVFDVDETPQGDCSIVRDSAGGATVAIANMFGTVNRSEVCDNGGKARFDDMLTGPGGSFFTNYYAVSIEHAHDCSSWSINCLQYSTGGLNIGGVSNDIDVLVTDSNVCGDIPVNVDLFENPVSNWQAVIDGNAYANAINSSAECSGDIPGSNFKGDFLQFSNPSGGINDAYALAHGEISTEAALCPSDAENCGSAQNTGMSSEWYNNVFSFRAPSTANEVEQVFQIYSGSSGVPVNVIEDTDLNDLIDVAWKTPAVLADIRVLNGEVGILYVKGTDSSPLDIKTEIIRQDTTNGYLLIITKDDVVIGEDVSTAIADYSPQARANIEAGIITSGTITIKGQGNSPANDLPVLLTGPLVAQNVIVERDLGLENDINPSVAVRYYPEFLYRITKIERNQGSCTLSEIEDSRTGLAVYDIAIDYGD